MLKHRDAWALEKTAPAKSEAMEPKEAATSPPVQERKNIAFKNKPNEERKHQPMSEAEPEGQNEILIVASKLKEYVRKQSGFNTSQSTFAALSDLVRKATDQAIENAKADGRKTVMDRDFQ